MEARRNGSRIVKILALVAIGFLAGWLSRGRDSVAAVAERIRETLPEHEAHPVFELELVSAAVRPAESSLCLLDGLHGSVIKGGTIYNRNSHVDFGRYTEGAFTVGIQGGEFGQIVDLGAASEFERVFGSSALQLLSWEDGELLIADTEFYQPDSASDPYGKTVLERVFNLPPSAAAKGMESAPVHMGHLYFVRIHDRHEGDTEIVGLLEVLEREVDKRVLVRGRQL